MVTQQNRDFDRGPWEATLEHDPVSRRSGRTRRAPRQTDHGYADDRKAPDLRRRAPPRDRGHRRQIPPREKRGEIEVNRHRASAPYLRMIFSENRFALFRIMLP